MTNRPRSSRGADKWPVGTSRVILLSASVNLALLLCFETARLLTNPGDLQTVQSSAALAAGGGPVESAPFHENNKGDLLASPRSLKESLRLTQVHRSHTSKSGADDDEPIGGADSATEEILLTAGPEQDSQAMAPILTRLPGAKEIRVGQFRSLTLNGDGEQCLEMGHSMLEDIGADGDLLDVLVASDAITIARICAANGNVTLTCRNNSIVISPRRPHPNDVCGPT